MSYSAGPESRICQHASVLTTPFTLVAFASLNYNGRLKHYFAYESRSTMLDITTKMTHTSASLLILVTFCLVLGCQKEATRPLVEEAPYKLTDENHLRVRPDLFAQLKFAKVERGEVIGTITGFGKVAFAPGALTALRVPFDGFTESVAAELGQPVAEGTVLAKIRSRELAKIRADVRRITADLDAEYDARDRTAMLVSQNAVNERKLIEVRSRIGSLEAERSGHLQSLQAARVPEDGNELFELKTPRSGFVIERRLDPGENAQDPDNEPAFVVADPTQLLIRVSFPERDAGLLREKFSCNVVIPSIGENKFPGHVTTVVPAVDEKNRTVHSVCKFDSLDPRIRAEMLARVTVNLQGEPKLLIPRSAVLLRRDAKVVLVRIGDCELERRVVTIGSVVDNRLEILSGVQADEEIVVEGAVLLDGELDRLL